MRKPMEPLLFVKGNESFSCLLIQGVSVVSVYLTEL